ncbi:hypothetical protein V8G61_07685 [Gaetbulibacter sp. M240]|uniref:hypothetical protein n=1 Tax=Gaetbulibacter sp. M240 TaxID=3126511 RepID=UPI00374FB57C
MKTMYLFFIFSFLIGVSCSSDTQPTIEQTEPMEIFSSNNVEEPQNIFLELYLHQYFLENELTLLNKRKQELTAEIEEGNDEKIPDLEEVQQQVEIYEKYQSYNEELIEGIIPIDRPPKPHPCDNPGSDNNCPVPTLGSFNTLVHPDQGEISTVFLNDDEPVSELNGVEESEKYQGLISYNISTTFIGEAVLKITKYYEPAGSEISYEVHVIIE